MIIKAALNFLRRLQQRFLPRDFILRHRVIVITVLHCHVVLASYALALCLRFDFQMPENYISMFWKTLPLLVVIRLLLYDFYKLNSGWWSFAGMHDLLNIIKAVSAGSVLFLIAIVFIYGTIGYPRSVFIIEPILNFIFIGGLRFGVRWIKETSSKTPPVSATRVLIVGAGQAGALERSIAHTAATEHGDGVATADVAGVHGGAQAGHDPTAQQAGDLGLGGGVDLGALPGSDQGLLAERSDAQRR